MVRRRLRWCAAALVAGGLVVSACSADDLAEEPEATDVLGTTPPTTALEKPTIDVTGQSYCQVAKSQAPSIRVFTDPSTNYGDPDVVQNVYLGALVAFDALSQVDTREIESDVNLLFETLNDAVDAAAAVGWDLTQVTDTAGGDVQSAQMAQALADVRQYTEQRCGVDIIGIEPPITTGPAETPAERQRRVISETFPVLSDDQVGCVATKLPLDWDPTSPNLDQDAAARALTDCGIDPDNPSRPTTTTAPPTDTTDG